MDRDRYRQKRKNRWLPPFRKRSLNQKRRRFRISRKKRNEKNMLSFQILLRISQGSQKRRMFHSLGLDVVQLQRTASNINGKHINPIMFKAMRTGIISKEEKFKSESPKKWWANRKTRWRMSVDHLLGTKNIVQKSRVLLRKINTNMCNQLQSELTRKHHRPANKNHRRRKKRISLN